MGLFKDPRSAPTDTKATYSRKRAPWLVMAAVACTYYVVTKPNPAASAWLAMGLVWVAALMAIRAADWSDLRNWRK
jgi:hypothetical protein